MTSVTTGRKPRRPIGVLVGALLLAHAAWGFVSPALAPLPLRVEVPGVGPLAHAGVVVALEERIVAPGRAYVDLRIGERRYPGGEPVVIDPDASLGDYTRRYAGRFRFAGPAQPGGGFAVVEVDTVLSSAAEAVWIVTRLDDDGTVLRQERRVPSRRATRGVAVDLLGAAPAMAPIWPPLAGLIAGGFLLAGALPGKRPRAWPAIGLVCACAALTSVFVWPVMLHLSLARTLPPVLLALLVTLLVAALSGPAAQATLRRAGAGRSSLAGAGYALGLLLVYVAAQVTINGFIAPIFRAPGGGQTPLALLFADYVRPALALTAVGLAPAALAGVVFAWLERRRADPRA